MLRFPNKIRNYDTDGKKSIKKPRKNGWQLPRYCGRRRVNGGGAAVRKSSGFFFLKKFAWVAIVSVGCARWGASGVLYPKSALCGAEFPLKGSVRNVGLSLIGRHATDGYEPRQVRKEAAISNAVCVVDRSRSWRRSLLSGSDSTEGAQPLSIFTYNGQSFCKPATPSFVKPPAACFYFRPTRFSS